MQSSISDGESFCLFWVQWLRVALINERHEMLSEHYSVVRTQASGEDTVGGMKNIESSLQPTNKRPHMALLPPMAVDTTEVKKVIS